MEVAWRAWGPAHTAPMAAFATKGPSVADIPLAGVTTDTISDMPERQRRFSERGAGRMSHGSALALQGLVLGQTASFAAMRDRARRRSRRFVSRCSGTTFFALIRFLAETPPHTPRIAPIATRAPRGCQCTRPVA